MKSNEYIHILIIRSFLTLRSFDIQDILIFYSDLNHREFRSVRTLMLPCKVPKIKAL